MKKNIMISVRLTAAALAIFALLSFAACNGGGKKPASTGDETNVRIDINNDNKTTGEVTEGGGNQSTGELVTDAGTGATETTPPPAGAMGKFEEDDAAIMINGVVLRLGADFLPYVDKIGEAEIVEGQACLEGGYDTNYYYGGEELVVYTLAEDGKQIIYDIYITTADYKTGKGAEVGKTTPEELTEMYGDPDENRFSTYEYRLGDTVVSFSFTEDDVLESIDIIDEGVTG